MRKLFALVAAVVAAATVGVGALGRSSAEPKVVTLRDLSLELVGQLENSAPGVTPATHVHYGYLAYVRGVTAFRGAPQDETTALFTFYADAATVRTIVDGPLRAVTRVGTLTIYRDAATNGDFAKPDTFRDGTPILVATLRQQSIVDTVAGTFTTFHQNRIVSTKTFLDGGQKLQLGVVGGQFTTEFRGHTNMPGPPSGYFAGFAISR
jgi:hypothetical protein